MKTEERGRASVRAQFESLIDSERFSVVAAIADENSVTEEEL